MFLFLSDNVLVSGPKNITFLPCVKDLYFKSVYSDTLHSPEKEHD